MVRRGTAKKDRLTSACSSTKIGRVPSMLQTTAEPGTCERPLHQKNFRRIGDFFQAGFFHFENADLVGRAEAVFHRAQNAETVAALAFEVKHGVDHVLEQARSGDGAVFGHVADQESRQAGFFVSTMIAPDASLTWAMLPGADGIAVEKIVCTESITSKPGLIFLT